jgi:carbonic anhydrase
LAKGQAPFALVLTCADSRVAPELVFDQGLGDLFVLRVAGNISEPAVLGSIEYALEHLHTPLIVVIGHESCGAVKAAVEGGHLDGNLSWLIERVYVGKGKPKDMKEAVKTNALRQAALLSEQSKIIKELVHNKRVQIVAGAYSLSTGKVDWFEGEERDAPAEVSHAGGETKSSKIRVLLPAADAKVSFNGVATTKTGTERLFASPALEPGKDYSYAVKATWNDNGKEVSLEKRVAIKGGEEVVVDFRK